MRPLAILTFVASLILAILPVQAEKTERRVAFIIGNSAYEHSTPLSNPVNDARAMSNTLARLGFDVVEGMDLKNEGMRAKIREFARRVRGADVAMLFYAGHGLQVDGKNYLVPVDAELKEEVDLDLNAIDIDLILKQMMREAKLKIVMLDACRDNPLAQELARSMGKTRSSAIGRGLAKLNTGEGTLIAFATEPGDVALDGDGTHSPFTNALLKHIETPGLEIQTMMTRVRGEVYQATKKSQLPWHNTSMTGEFYMKPVQVASLDPSLVPSTSATDAPAATPVIQSPVPSGSAWEMEQALWQAADKSNRKEDYQAYLETYPNGHFAKIAKNRVNRLSAPTPQPIAPVATNADRKIAVLGVGSAAPVAATPVVDPQAAEAALGLSRNQRSEVQRRLTLIGFSTRGVDGAWGPNTRSAIAGWQASRNLTANGFIDQAQYAALLQQSQAAYTAFVNRPQPKVVRKAAPKKKRVVRRATTRRKVRRRQREVWVEDNRPRRRVVRRHRPAGGSNAGAVIAGAAAGAILLGILSR